MEQIIYLGVEQCDLKRKSLSSPEEDLDRNKVDVIPHKSPETEFHFARTRVHPHISNRTRNGLRLCQERLSWTSGKKFFTERVARH